MVLSLAVSRKANGEWTVKVRLAVGFSLWSWLQS
ncbi:hypothetical protein MTDSW087_04904 [Methylobacterium dankookense]|uniref:Uncharacterized protein n=1 Tax=Methylobacterium dankookense TaxID=560405 RepID=A0A564G3U6_9HYPH|nr:hypothetical protein IFDJLNFL_4625 [Methylobacterium dankookense]VUF15169.1 hypothetical protein MTDSW087_04904 [Methylobacterium dankookense]